MKWRHLRPGRKQLLAWLGLVVYAFAAPVFELPLAVAWVLLALLVLLFIDGWRLKGLPTPELKRVVANNLSVGRWSEVALHLSWHGSRPLELEVTDHHPATVDIDYLPQTIRLLPDSRQLVHYRIRPLIRGPMTLGPCQLRVNSTLGFWQWSYDLGSAREIKIYPDFTAIAGQSIHATDNPYSLLGVKRKPRRGEGLDFLQLREYRQGDSLRQIDWKATSRKAKLIAREYTDERDQQVVVMLDCGRRMRARDGDISHFDQSLNAVLLLSYIALRQGDSLSVMAFGKNLHWVPVHKGAAAINSILNQVYHLHPENHPADYLEAARELMVRQSKRSLVVLLTNLRDEDTEEIRQAVELMRRKHLVVVASLKETAVESLLGSPIATLDDALGFAGAQHYVTQRRSQAAVFRNQGVFYFDCLPKHLPVQLASSYLEIKRSSLL